MSSIGEKLLAASPYVVAIGVIAALLWYVLDIRKFFQERKTNRSEAIKAVEKYTKDAKELADKINSAGDLWEIWDAKLPSTPEAERLMKETYSLYHGIFMHRENGNFPDNEWKGAKEEMAHFLSFGFIQTNIGFADTLSHDFGSFMRQLTPKRRVSL